MTEREERLEQALVDIYAWCKAYDLKIFTPLNDDKIELAGEILKLNEIDIGAMHAQWARHLLDGIGKIAKEALDGQP